MKSSSQHSFAMVPGVDIPRASFKRNMNYKTTLNAGYLVPIFLDEVLPGDTFNLNLTSFARITSPLKYPIMDNLYMDFQFFFVPIRLVYADYEKFFGSSAGREGNWQYDDSHLMPGITSPEGGWQEHSIADYFGLPTGVENIRVNALPFRCYNQIIADWYRPSSYELASPEVKIDSTDDNNDLYVLQKRMKRADYFTAGLPAPQRGPGVDLPLGDTAPVVGNGRTMNFVGLFPDNVGQAFSLVTPHTSGDARYALETGKNSQGVVGTVVERQNVRSNQLGTVGLSVHPGSSGLIADLSSATAISINTLRQAFQLQRALERDQRGGVRYISQRLSHFGVRSPDARLQRSEYLGGGSTPIQIHTVANTAGGDDPQASLTAYGVSSKSGVGFVKSFVEHGYVIGLASVRADLTYQQGVPRMFDRWARFDFYYPVFAHLGEQIIKNKEIFAQGTDVDDEPFAYQERFGEYRYGVSKITGQFRSTNPLTLDAYHLAQKFNNLPTLNSEFLMENVPMSRVKAVTDGPDFLYDSYISLNCVRPMPLFGVPGLVDHF